jgi:tetratricopeptide (TPR) repeat protein
MSEGRCRRLINAVAYLAAVLGCIAADALPGAAQVVTVDQANELIRRAESEFQRGHGREAITLWQQALTSARAAGDRNAQALLLENLGSTAQLLGEPGEATKYLAEAWELARRLNDANLAGRVLERLAESARAAKDDGLIIVAYRELLARAEARGDRSAQALDAAVLGRALLDEGKPAEAATLLRRAAELWRADGRREDTGLALYFLGQAMIKLEGYLEAVDAYREAAVIAGESGDRSREADALRGLGNGRYLLGDFDGAARVLREALSLARRSGERAIEASVLMSQGNVDYYRKQPHEAVRSWEQALKLARDFKDREMEGKVLGNLALAYTQLKDRARAEDYYQQDLAIARERGDRLVEAQALHNFATLRLASGDWAAAIPLLRNSVELAGSVGYRRGQALALRNLGRAQLKTHDPAGAEDSLRAAITIFEGLREPVRASDADSISLLQSQRDAYSYLQAALVALNKPGIALEVSERGRARSIADLLARREAASGQLTMPSVETMLALARSRKATLVEFSIVDDADSAIYVWVVRPDGTTVFRRTAIDMRNGGSIDAAMESFVRDTRAALGALGRFEVPPAKPGVAGRDEMLELLYRLLIAPVADELPKSPDETVVLVPQGPLFLLPFAALRDPSGRALIDRHTILVMPSIGTLALLDAQPARRADTAALVVGNPALSPVRLEARGDLVQLPLLPGAEREANSVASLLRSVALTGPMASKDAVLRKMPEADIIHFATHGILEDVRNQGAPGALALVGSGTDEGLLTTPEIMNLRIRAQLVVLSACNTGAGRITSDGVVGLTRAFIAAGARNVVASLWNAPDQPTEGLMVAFYQALQRGQSKARALRQAMLDTRAHHADPLDWAGFILMGADQ